MSVWEAVVLGLVQGAGEFLPVSSSGHLLLLEKLGVGEEDLFFNICLHLGTLLSVIIVMRRPLLSLFRKEHRRTLLFLILACLPTVALALLFKYLAPALIDGAYLPLGFAATSFLLILSEKFSPAENRPLSVKTSVLTGFLQGIAVKPSFICQNKRLNRLFAGYSRAPRHLAERRHRRRTQAFRGAAPCRGGVLFSALSPRHPRLRAL